jgi:hypothetical protein
MCRHAIPPERHAQAPLTSCAERSGILWSGTTSFACLRIRLAIKRGLNRSIVSSGSRWLSQGIA